LFWLTMKSIADEVDRAVPAVTDGVGFDLEPPGRLGRRPGTHSG